MTFSTTFGTKKAKDQAFWTVRSLRIERIIFFSWLYKTALEICIFIDMASFVANPSVVSFYS